MRFKDPKAQITIEYFILFLALAVVTLLTISNFFPRLKTMGEDFFKIAANRILQ
ncbi:MAG: hypothetical protein V1674_06570 [Candidatus Omnitrophota bacterium]